MEEQASVRLMIQHAKHALTLGSSQTVRPGCFTVGKKMFPPLVGRPYGALETNCALEEGSRKTRISRREKGIEKQERRGGVPVSVVPLERGVLSRRTVVAVETIKRAISDGVLPLMSLIILLLTFCAVICVLQLHRPHRKLRSSF